MKKFIVFAILLLAIYTTCTAQTKAPKVVLTSFNTKFSNAKNIKWEKENDHEYEASFEWKDAKYSANFSNDGKWLETEQIITFNQLPEKVQQAFNTAHKAAKVKVVASIETSKGETKYEVEIKQGAKTIEKFYTAQGNEIEG